MDFTPKLANVPIERATSSKFLRVIVDENLTWKTHIAALKTKMNRNAGILFKMKGILPLTVLKSLYHCFIQSHLNHCPLVWGMGTKHNLEPLFTAQKRAIRTLIPGFANYFYNKDTGEHPCHTKPAFYVNGIPTVHNLILQRLLTFMHKVNSHTAITQMINMFSLLDFETDTYNHKNILSIFLIPDARLKPHKNSIFAKGPSLYPKILHEIELFDPTKYHSLRTKLDKPFKNCIKSYLIKLQSQGSENEWSAINFRLHLGSRSSTRSKHATTIT